MRRSLGTPAGATLLGAKQIASGTAAHQHRRETCVNHVVKQHREPDDTDRLIVNCFARQIFHMHNSLSLSLSLSLQRAFQSYPKMLSLFFLQ